MIIVKKYKVQRDIFKRVSDDCMLVSLQVKEVTCLHNITSVITLPILFVDLFNSLPFIVL